jgi:predicted nucleic acid-binding Zn ribbon protein
VARTIGIRVGALRSWRKKFNAGQDATAHALYDGFMCAFANRRTSRLSTGRSSFPLLDMTTRVTAGWRKIENREPAEAPATSVRATGRHGCVIASVHAIESARSASLTYRGGNFRVALQLSSGLPVTSTRRHPALGEY